jgi:small subunit ribosomal protein S1
MGKYADEADESTGPGGSPEQGEWGKSTEFARLLAQYESSREAETPAVGSQVRGRIVLIGEGTTFVDFGGRSEGAVDTLHFRDAAGKITAEVGMMVNLFVVDNRDQVILAPSVKAEPTVALSQIVDARRTGMPVTGQVVGLNAGGLEVDIAGLRAFCPVSQVEANYCPDASIYLGRSLEFLVTELAEGGKRLVVSRKALLRRQEEERVRELIGSIKEGTELDGTVSRLESFGAFVDLGGVDGLVHVSEIRYERTESPSDVLTVGQKVRVRVLGLKETDGSRTKISLSIKAATPDPWNEAEERFWPGRRVHGNVVRLAEFGAFVNLAPGIDGLVHVSEVAAHPVAHPRDALQEGQQVEALVLSVDTERRRISLSVRDALASLSGEPAVEGNEQAGTAATPPAPKAGDLVDGWVAGIKPYGLFVDLPTYGHRARGLVPHEETGEKRGTDLARRFRVGDQLKVEITDVDQEGRIRLSLVRAKQREDQAGFVAFQAGAEPARPANTAVAEALRRAMERQKENPQ